MQEKKLKFNIFYSEDGEEIEVLIKKTLIDFLKEKELTIEEISNV